MRTNAHPLRIRRMGTARPPYAGRLRHRLFHRRRFHALHSVLFAAALVGPVHHVAPGHGRAALCRHRHRRRRQPRLGHQQPGPGRRRPVIWRRQPRLRRHGRRADRHRPAFLRRQRRHRHQRPWPGRRQRRRGRLYLQQRQPDHDPGRRLDRQRHQQRRHRGRPDVGNNPGRRRHRARVHLPERQGHRPRHAADRRHQPCVRHQQRRRCGRRRGQRVQRRAQPPRRPVPVPRRRHDRPGQLRRRLERRHGNQRPGPGGRFFRHRIRSRVRQPVPGQRLPVRRRGAAQSRCAGAVRRQRRARHQQRWSDRGHVDSRRPVARLSL
jgi:hypothetical protein